MTYKYYLYKTAESPEEEIASVQKLLDEVQKKHGISYSIIDIAALTGEQKEELLESIRLISRKNGKGVVSKGRGALPISRSGQPGNIGILLQIENEKPKDVFPHLKNGKRISALMHLRELMQADNIDEIRDCESLSEQDISKMIITLPELLEEGLEFIETEVETEGGRIDAVFKDKNGAHLLIEIELKANDNAIAQVQRFKIPYSEKSRIPAEMIRLGLVCTEIGNSRLVACKGAGIGVYKLNLLKLA